MVVAAGGDAVVIGGADVVAVGARVVVGRVGRVVVGRVGRVVVGRVGGGVLDAVGGGLVGNGTSDVAAVEVVEPATMPTTARVRATRTARAAPARRRGRE